MEFRKTYPGMQAPLTFRTLRDTLVSEARLDPPSLRKAACDFREFVDTLVAGLRAIEKAERPIRYIHPVMVREGDPPALRPSFFHDLDSLKTKYVLAKAGEPIE